MAKLSHIAFVLALAVVLIWAMIAYEHRGYGPGRDALGMK